MEIEELLKEKSPGMRLELEIGTTLMLEFAGVAGRQKGLFVGMVRDEYLVVHLESVSSLHGKFFPGSQVVIRFLAGGMVYGFQSAIRSLFTEHGIRLLFVSYPKIVQNVSLRKHRRFESYLRCSLHVHEKKHEGIMLDLSITGCKLSVSMDDAPSFDIGERISLSFKLPGVSGVQHVEGSIRNVFKDSQDLRLGIRFERGDTSVAKNIKSYVKSMLDLV